MHFSLLFVIEAQIQQHMVLFKCSDFGYPEPLPPSEGCHMLTCL